MKITIHSLDELYELSEVIAYGIGARDAARQPRGWEVTESDVEQPINELRKTFDKVSDFLGKRHATPEEQASAHPPQQAVTETVVSIPVETTPVAPNETPDDETQTEAVPELDADGRRWDERIDASSKALTAKGVWRARRNHGLSDEEVEAIKREGTVAPPETADDAPAVTETHPLPTDEPQAGVPEPAPAPTEDDDAELKATFFELVEQARKPAEDIQKDDVATTLQAAQAFTKAHSPHAFRLLRETITDKTLPGMTPGERRVLLAAMELYKPGGEA